MQEGFDSNMAMLIWDFMYCALITELGDSELRFRNKKKFVGA